MTPQEMRDRLLAFGRAAIRFATPLTDVRATAPLATQLIRSATGASANYRSAGRARSHAEFCAKLALALEEMDEAVHWLELLKEADGVDREKLQTLLEEGGELTAILAKSKQTAYRNRDDDKKHSGRQRLPVDSATRR